MHQILKVKGNRQTLDELLYDVVIHFFNMIESLPVFTVVRVLQSCLSSR